MESLTREKLEAVLDELAILGVDCTLPDFRAVIPVIVEERMTDPIEVNTDLVGTACLETTFHDCHIAEAFEDTIVCHRMFSMITVWEDLEAHTVVRVTTDITYDGTLIILEIAPYDSHITTLDRVYEELLCEVQLSLLVLSDNKQS
jgi:hypothetical protein